MVRVGRVTWPFAVTVREAMRILHWRPPVGNEKRHYRQPLHRFTAFDDSSRLASGGRSHPNRRGASRPSAILNARAR